MLPCAVGWECQVRMDENKKIPHYSRALYLCLQVQMLFQNQGSVGPGGGLCCYSCVKMLKEAKELPGKANQMPLLHLPVGMPPISV
jgi:hypothetical protein